MRSPSSGSRQPIQGAAAYWDSLVKPVLGRDAHRPQDRDSMRVAAVELHQRGLTPADIATALRLSEAAVLELLEERRP